ncbi:uncharacterized protein ARMOST_18900 [Armillaria ostoyae]|uniref:Uncharacterized protein n=1 Tax=Armillaria ostoyae TaxID=47428 RepID=A0A284S307_ARMOS|nr:uncharacterized protein ARMOST_18900 [Armillaria ostoyae]
MKTLLNLAFESYCRAGTAYRHNYSSQYFALSHEHRGASLSPTSWIFLRSRREIRKEMAVMIRIHRRYLSENVFNERRACSRPEPSYAESDSTDSPKIHPHILIEATMSYWLARRCSIREQVVADRLPHRLYLRSDIGQIDKDPVYVRVGATTMIVLPSRYSSTREENLKGSDMINDQKMSS